ncbi:NYN domain-containing protein [Psychrobacillus sp. FSL K6-2684]|uniref:NYN domain-containing protein n=1 Tax=Psychrobacillus faecigallinarum TaxID=2762235 RepID=A0ABR8RB41_9BACI|nr:MULTISPECIES: NYN domain-containing protein [Psychrobacillus]MBD7945015.1 NYN domain-containing protein [Psychrobacillus faecigallinarum]QEY21520.1 NYN domain-containing protein [Psychrobacillus sp. AK 1817]
MQILLVDGYNIIGAWSELRKLKKDKLLDARDRLIEQMAEYKAFTGIRVIVVFDAHLVPGIENKKKQYDVEIIYTRENETADERIEKLTRELSGRRVQIYVATSDMTEQRVIFGQGALRKSARELEIEMLSISSNITKKVKNIQENKPTSTIILSEEVAEIFEKWRRGMK